jgi:hypothetical protein
MKFISLVGFTLLLNSCSKDTTPVIGGNNDNNVSGKLKKIIQSVTGTGTAYITSLEYDVSNRVTKFNEWYEDSTFTPIRISNANYSVFTYTGASTYPAKNTITDEAGAVDSTIYYYDIQNRVIREDYYQNNYIVTRNIYSYISPALTKAGKYYSSGGVLQLNGTDSMLYDSQGKITETRFYNSLNIYSGKDTYLYDVKSNPLAALNVFKVVYSLYGDDRKDFYKSLNNLLMYSNVAGSSITTISVNYSYS